MHVLLSGEGPTDIGTGIDSTRICEGTDFLHGPMALFIDQIIERHHGYSILEVEACGYVSEGLIAAHSDEIRPSAKSLGLPGRKRAKETRYFFNTARILARIAKRVAVDENVEVVAVLFRDADGTASAGRGEWVAKFHSMLDGFAEEAFASGVPMVPKPKSEAWLLCALKDAPYQACQGLEERSGNDASPNSLKGELAELLGQPGSRELFCELVRNHPVDCFQIDMRSFSAFRTRFESVIGARPTGA